MCEKCGRNPVRVALTMTIEHESGQIETVVNIVSREPKNEGSGLHVAIMKDKAAFAQAFFMAAGEAFLEGLQKGERNTIQRERPIKWDA